MVGSRVCPSVGGGLGVAWAGEERACGWSDGVGGDAEVSEFCVTCFRRGGGMRTVMLGRGAAMASELVAFVLWVGVAACSSKSDREPRDATFGADGAAHDGGIARDAATLDGSVAPPPTCGGGCGGPPARCGQCRSLCGCCACLLGEVVTLADQPDSGLFLCTASRCYAPLASDAGPSPR